MRSRAEEELARVKTELSLAQSVLEQERTELLQRLARAEAVTRAREAEVCWMITGATDNITYRKSTNARPQRPKCVIYL